MSPDDKPLKGDALAADTKARQQTASRKAENREYGETISEHGMGGQTTSAGVPGAEKNEKRGKYDTNDEKEKEQDKARIEQRYGGGSGVGA